MKGSTSMTASMIDLGCSIGKQGVVYGVDLERHTIADLNVSLTETWPWDF